MIINSDFYHKILDHISSGVYFVDHERTITYWNKGAEKLSGFPAEDVVGKKCSSFLNHVDDKGKVLCGDGCPLFGTISDGEPRQAEVFMLHKLGQRVPVLVQAMPMENGGVIIGAVEIFHDISPLKLAQARIQELTDEVYQDKLTGAYNRRGIEKMIQHWFSDYLQTGYPFGIVFIDIDLFKNINDAYGHLVGDQILIQISKRLKSNLRETDVVGRWGGDEYLLLLHEVNQHTLEKVMQKISAFLNQEPYPIEKGQLSVTCSMGGGIVNENERMKEFLDRVDDAMYSNKKINHSMIH